MKATALIWLKKSKKFLSKFYTVLFFLEYHFFSQKVSTLKRENDNSKTSWFKHYTKFNFAALSMNCTWHPMAHMVNLMRQATGMVWWESWSTGGQTWALGPSVWWQRGRMSLTTPSPTMTWWGSPSWWRRSRCQPPCSSSCLCWRILFGAASWELILLLLFFCGSLTGNSHEISNFVSILFY